MSVVICPMTEEICVASSRVGEMIRHCVPFGDEELSSCRSIGRAKASVFPLPVCASTMWSPPLRILGIALDWTGVGVVIPSVRSDSSIFGCLSEAKFDIGFKDSVSCMVMVINGFLQPWYCFKKAGGVPRKTLFQ